MVGEATFASAQRGNSGMLAAYAGLYESEGFANQAACRPDPDQDRDTL